MRLQLSAVFTGMLLAGCVSVGNERLLDETTVAQIKAGETTKAQVTVLLGEPTYQRSTQVSGYTYEWWSYKVATSTINPLEYLLLVGFTQTDTTDAVMWMAEKIAGLRLFPDAAGRMNLPLADVGGAVLVVSQFTLYGDARKGRRPSFVEAAGPDLAVPLYEAFLTALRAQGLTVAAGVFGAMMAVELVNDGPVTLLLKR